MLMIVTIYAQEFPIAAIGGVVVMIVVFVMNRQFSKALSRKFASAARADVRVHLQGPSPVTLLSLFDFPTEVGTELIPLFGVWSLV